MRYFTGICTTLFFILIVVCLGFRVEIAKYILESHVEIAKDILKSHDFEVIPPSPELSITGLSLADSSKRVITDEDEKFLKPNSNGFIKVTVKNDGGTAKNVTINFRFLDPDDEDAVKYGQPILDKLKKGEKFKEASKDLNFVIVKSSEKTKKLRRTVPELKKGTKEVYTKIDVGNVKPRYVCVEVELSEQDRESGKLEVRDSEYYVLLVYNP